MTSTLKVFLFSSALLAVATADTCTDCTAVVSTIAARLMSEESLAAQGVIILLSSNNSNFPRLSWLVDSAQAQRMWLSVRQTFANSGK